MTHEANCSDYFRYLILDICDITRRLTIHLVNIIKTGHVKIHALIEMTTFATEYTVSIYSLNNVVF